MSLALEPISRSHEAVVQRGEKSTPPVRAGNRQSRPAANANSRKLGHQAQYTDPVANFFDIFNGNTGRDTLFWGYLSGYLVNKPNLLKKDNIAVDFGCGTGWLALHLAEKFDHVYGIDTSAEMLKIAIENTRDIPKIRYDQSARESIKGACDFVSAVHVHYHFDTEDKLRRDFFGAAASLLKPDGELALIGCPSNYIHRTPEHYRNHIHTSDIPAVVLEKSSQLSLIADEGGFVALDKVPSFPLKDGCQMKVIFRTNDIRGRLHKIELTDTYWSDQTLTRAAASCGLELIRQENHTWRQHPNAYMTMHFRKISTPQV